MIRKIRLSAKLSLLLVPFAPILLLLGWQRWVATTPQSLPTTSGNGTTPLTLGQYYETAIAPIGKAQAPARYRLWLPDGVPTLRGVIVKQHGCGDPAAATGLDHAHDLQWQALAAQHQLGLMGVQLPTGYPLCTDAAIADRETERAFLQALPALARESHHPELAKVPWVLWGHSGGADWGMQMLRHYPERVIAVVNLRCGGILNTAGQSELFNLSPEANPKLLAVPVLWLVGRRDPYAQECVELPQQVFAKYRSANAVWTLAIEPTAQHEAGNSRDLAIPYLDAILVLRLPRSGTQLRPLDPTQGWLGDLKTQAIAAMHLHQSNLPQFVWLPSATVATQWREYVQTGTVAPTRPPAPPMRVQAVRTGATQVVVTWHFMPDRETGLPKFQIYRNHTLIKTFNGQEHNFGDAPIPPAVVLEFQDEAASAHATYAVAAVNQIGTSLAVAVQAPD